MRVERDKPIARAERVEIIKCANGFIVRRPSDFTYGTGPEELAYVFDGLAGLFSWLNSHFSDVPIDTKGVGSGQ